MQRVVWTVVHRSSKDEPQQQTKRYTAESANRMATIIIDDGGVAAVVEHDEDDVPDITDDASALAAQGTGRRLVW